MPDGTATNLAKAKKEPPKIGAAKMSVDVKPALTPEQWGQWLTPKRVHLLGGTRVDLTPHAGVCVTSGAALEGGVIRHVDRFAVAAMCLQGRPYAFTPDDVEHLRLVAGKCLSLKLGVNHATVLRDLAERIAALLPPEPAP